MVDPSRTLELLLSAGHVVDGCRQLERRVADEGQMIARLLGEAATREHPRHSDGDATTPALHSAYLVHLQDFAAAVQALRVVLEELITVAAVENPLQPTTRRAPILIVDDHDDTRTLIASTLQMADLEVVTASNGLEGLLAAHTCRPALIVMDVQMPILTGIETARLLKATAAMRSIPVIAHTARPDACSGHAAALFAHVLPKPTHPNVLVALVRRFVPVVAPH